MSDNSEFASLHNGQAIPRREIPDLPLSKFRTLLLGAVAGGQRVSALFGDGPTAQDEIEIYAYATKRSVEPRNPLAEIDRSYSAGRTPMK